MSARSTIELLDFFEELKGDPGARRSILLDQALYSPSPHLAAYVQELGDVRAQAAATNGKQRRLHLARAGRLMEAIAKLLLEGIAGGDAVKSFLSSGAQYDLVVTGSSKLWLTMMRVVCPGAKAQSILVEAKATKSKVNDATFHRLCGVVGNYLLDHVGLAIFMTLAGATGFPKRGAKVLGLRQARLAQLLFFAKNEIPIVVLDFQDLVELANGAPLLPLLQAKVVEISEQMGVWPSPPDGAHSDLPSHLLAIPANPAHF
ncbi:MAG TPA: hypothetical protein VLC09_20165 [Polyangiaceae bacterium]|nr:hypothetical protein [Polyangiaceae bacterium]